MSIKIPHGYYIENRSLFELKTLIDEFRRKVRVLSEKVLCGRMPGMCASVIDHSHAGSIIPHADEFLELGRDRRRLISGVYDICLVRHRKVRETDIRDPEFDLECELAFHPLEDKILCILIAEQEEYHKTWRTIPGVVPYAYQNSTDRPKGIAEVQWDRRHDQTPPP